MPSQEPGIVNPEPISHPDPKYTPEAEDYVVQGSVLLRLTVSKQGIPADIEVIRPIGYGLDENAVATVSTWRFRPGTRNGQPVEVSAQVQVTFRFLHPSPKTLDQWSAFRAALTEAQKQNFSKVVVDTFRKLADEKFVPAMYEYGSMLRKGNGLPADEKRGFDLVKKAAAKHWGPALYDVATAEMDGSTDPKTLAEAFEKMQAAAKFGSLAAERYVGNAFETGEGLPDGERFRFAESQTNFRLCAAYGYRDCQYRLGASLLKHSEHPALDRAQAIAWLQLAVDAHDEDAEKLLQESNFSAAQTTAASRLKSSLLRRP